MRQEYFYEMLKYKPLLFKKLVAKFNHAHKDTANIEVKFENNSFDFLSQNFDILDYLNLNTFDFSWDYSTNEKIFTLLSKKELTMLAYYFGTCMHANEISLIITKEELHFLKQEISEKLYVYALEKGQYRAQNLAKIVSSFSQDLSILDKIKLHGQEALTLLAENWTEEEKAKLPKLSQAKCPEIQNLNDRQKSNLINTLKKILIKDITSEWQQCLD